MTAERTDRELLELAANEIKAREGMLYDFNGDWVVADHGGWMPGAYTTRDAAILSFLVPIEELDSMQKEANKAGPGGALGFDTVRAAAAMAEGGEHG